MVDVYIVDDFSSEHITGVGSYLTQLRYGLENNKKVRVHYIWLNSSTKYKTFFKKQEKNGEHLFIPDSINSINQSSEKATEILAKCMQQSSNVVLHINWIQHCHFAQLMKKQIHCTILYVVHCTLSFFTITGSYNVFKRLKDNRTNTFFLQEQVLEKIAYDVADYIIAVSDFTKKYLIKGFDVMPSKISTILNGFRHTQKPVKREFLRLQYNFALNEKIILFAGGIRDYKGVSDLVSAFERIAHENTDIRLILIGGGDFSFLFKHVKKYWSKITITGPLDKKRLYDFYQIADIGIVPSYIETCSYTAIEMMCFGLPIIVSDVDGLTEIVPNNCGLKVKRILGKNKACIDTRQLAEKMQFYLDNETVAKQYAANAQHHARINLTAKRMIAETIAVYEKLVAKNNEQLPALIIENRSLVSVLLPVYNGEKFIQECIDSILKQTYSNFELLIVDDGSIDKTSAIVRKYKDKRIIYVKNEQNEGIVSGLNKGIAIAKGKYIARIDADDMMHPERLQKQVGFLENEKNKEIALVGSHNYIIDYTGAIISLKQYPISDIEIKASMFFQCPFSHPSVMLRTTVIKKNKYTKKYKHAEDYNLWFKITAKHKAANIPEFLTYYRLHETNISKLNNSQQRENAAELLSKELDRLGIKHTAQELSISIAMAFGYKQHYFNTDEKNEGAKKWITKILVASNNHPKYSDNHIKKMQQYVVENYCGIY